MRRLRRRLSSLLGFTFVELLVVSAVVGLVTASVIPRQSLQARQEVATHVINRARNYVRAVRDLCERADPPPARQDCWGDNIESTLSPAGLAAAGYGVTGDFAGLGMMVTSLSNPVSLSIGTRAADFQVLRAGRFRGVDHQHDGGFVQVNFGVPQALTDYILGELINAYESVGGNLPAGYDQISVIVSRSIEDSELQSAYRLDGSVAAWHLRVDMAGNVINWGGETLDADEPTRHFNLPSRTRFFYSENEIPKQNTECDFVDAWLYGEYDPQGGGRETRDLRWEQVRRGRAIDGDYARNKSSAFVYGGVCEGSWIPRFKLDTLELGTYKELPGRSRSGLYGGSATFKPNSQTFIAGVPRVATSEADAFDGSAIPELLVPGDFIAGLAFWTNAYLYYSDERTKENIRDLGEEDIVDLTSLRTVRYRDNRGDSGVGFLAQDVENYYPELVRGPAVLTLDYGGIVPLAVAEMRRQQQDIDALEAQIKLLESLENQQ